MAGFIKSVFERLTGGRGSLRALFAFGGALALAGCALPVASDLTVFHEWPDQAPRTYRFVTNEAQLDSLEHASYRQVMRTELARIGFTESQTPRFELRFDAMTVPRTERRLDYAYPYVQPWFYWGTWGRHGGVSIATPWPGYYGGYAVERDVTWYEYRLSITIRDLAAGGRKVYEANAVASGSAPSIAGAMPYLARAVFADFPGLSGVPRRVEVPLEAVAR